MGFTKKTLLGHVLLLGGGLAVLSVLGALLTMHSNYVLHADNPVKLIGFSPVVTVLVLGLAVVLLWRGVVITPRAVWSLGLSFIILGVGLLLITNIFPVGLRIDLLAFFSMQKWPNAIAVTALVVGIGLALVGHQKRRRETHE
ncbi:MAG: hypothetical protein ACE5G0_07225 [Rhodothermales bacterium]